MVNQFSIALVLLDRDDDHEQCVLSWTSKMGGGPWRAFKLVVPDMHAIALAQMSDDGVYGYILAKEDDATETFTATTGQMQ
jgi:hypothetical protein